MWLDGPTAVATATEGKPMEAGDVPPPFLRRPLAPSLQAPTPEPPHTPPATAPQTTAASRWYWTTQGWLWGWQDQSGFVHPAETNR